MAIGCTRRPKLALLFAAFLSACAHNPKKAELEDQTTPEKLITNAEIAATGAHTAWDVLRQHASYLTVDRRDGSPGRLQNRGQSSIYLSDGPVVFLDGVRITDVRNLQYLPAQDIETIRIISGIRGTTHYGTNAGNGVVIIQTKSS